MSGYTARMSDALSPAAEHRYPALIAAVLALALFAVVPGDVRVLPEWVVPAVGAIALLPSILINPKRLNTETTWSRWMGIGFALGLTAVNQIHVVRLVIALVNDRVEGPSVLLTALLVWITNALAFSLVYWELDLGGPVARRMASSEPAARQDFRFPQQDTPTGVEGWRPSYLDYAFIGVITMMAFSPTDTMPLTVRAKALIAYQAFTGFVLLALVISRAVGILT